MARVTMRVAMEPLPEDARLVVSMRGDHRPILTGGGRTTLLCGACGLALARRVDPGSIGSVVLQCPRCCAPNVLATD